MKLVELSIDKFMEYQSTHPLSSLYQTVNYAMLKAENNYDYDLLGLLDNAGNILAATLILLRPIGIKRYYGYAPRGFLIDYNNIELVRTFTDLLKEYYEGKRCIFIKLNPNLKVGTVDLNTKEIIYNEDNKIKYVLDSLEYKKLLDNLYFESQLPRFNAIVNLKDFNPEKLNKNTRNKIKKSIRKGLKFEKCGKEMIPEFYKLVKRKLGNNEHYYQDYYTVFEKNNSIDLFLVSVDYYDYLQNSQYIYNAELEKNNILNSKLVTNNNMHKLNAKMQSDKTLLSYKNDILEASKGMSEGKKLYLAGALVIRHNDTATIIFSGFNKELKRYAANYFLHYNLIKYYQNDFNYLDLNGVVGNFKEENAYTGLNRFKLGFNPIVYEYIGEYDLVLEPKNYTILLQNGVLAKEFNKKIKE